MPTACVVVGERNRKYSLLQERAGGGSFRVDLTKQNLSASSSLLTLEELLFYEETTLANMTFHRTPSVLAITMVASSSVEKLETKYLC